MVLLAFHDRSLFKTHLAYLEDQHNKGNYLPWCPEVGCDTYVVIESDTLQRVMDLDKEMYGQFKFYMNALADEADFNISFIHVERPIQIKRYLNGKPKGRPKCKVVYFENLSKLIEEMKICTTQHYRDSIIYK